MICWCFQVEAKGRVAVSKQKPQPSDDTIDQSNPIAKNGLQQVEAFLEMLGQWQVLPPVPTGLEKNPLESGLSHPVWVAAPESQGAQYDVPCSRRNTMKT